jgi:glycosyltransferase involved in cell wall biosynthesis
VLPVSVAKAIDTEICSLYGKKLRTKVIYNGINPAKFAHIRTLYPTRGENSLILLHIGSFSPVKNHELLIEAFSRVEKQIPKIYLWLVGDGAERPKIEELVKDKQIIEKVRFLGIRDDIPNLLAQADIFVLCSNSEAFPVAILEAMASGLPVVATAVGGVPEAVINGKTGILVPPNNPEALADAIFQLASNEALRQQMGMNARQRVAGLFDVKRITREYERLYIEELNRRLKERNHVKTAKSI